MRQRAKPLGIIIDKPGQEVTTAIRLSRLHFLSIGASRQRPEFFVARQGGDVTYDRLGGLSGLTLSGLEGARNAAAHQAPDLILATHRGARNRMPRRHR